ncbi:MAG TPA: hypothetical protein VF789_12980 [Thermoanaerobaculia bacterium]
MRKLARFLGLSLIVAATALPAEAARRCSCDLCLFNDPATRCKLDGQNTTCGAFLIVALCPVG